MTTEAAESTELFGELILCATKRAVTRRRREIHGSTGALLLTLAWGTALVTSILVGARYHTQFFASLCVLLLVGPMACFYALLLYLRHCGTSGASDTALCFAVPDARLCFARAWAEARWPLVATELVARDAAFVRQGRDAQGCAIVAQLLDEWEAALLE